MPPKKKNELSYPVCDEKIRESTGQRSGDDAVECEGAWHCRCAGQRLAYDRVSKSSDPLFCPSAVLINKNSN